MEDGEVVLIYNEESEVGEPVSFQLEYILRTASEEHPYLYIAVLFDCCRSVPENAPAVTENNLEEEDKEETESNRSFDSELSQCSSILSADAKTANFVITYGSKPNEKVAIKSTLVKTYFKRHQKQAIFNVER